MGDRPDLTYMEWDELETFQLSTHAPGRDLLGRILRLRDIDNANHGWGSVSRRAFAFLHSYDGETNTYCDFPQQTGWCADAAELDVLPELDEGLFVGESLASLGPDLTPFKLQPLAYDGPNGFEIVIAALWGGQMDREAPVFRWNAERARSENVPIDHLHLLSLAPPIPKLDFVVL